jgi:hypothetical protein
MAVAEQGSARWKKGSDGGKFESRFAGAHLGHGLVVVRVDAALRSYPAKLFAVSAMNKASTISLTTQELLFIQSLTLGMAFSAFLPKSRIISAGSATRSRASKRPGADRVLRRHG